jgi:hypothetical protein
VLRHPRPRLWRRRLLRAERDQHHLPRRLRRPSRKDLQKQGGLRFDRDLLRQGRRFAGLHPGRAVQVAYRRAEFASDPEV